MRSPNFFLVLSVERGRLCIAAGVIRPLIVLVTIVSETESDRKSKILQLPEQELREDLSLRTPVLVSTF